MYIWTELGHFLSSATNLKRSSATLRKISRSEILFLVPQRTPDDCHWNYSAVSHARLKHNVPGILHLAISPWSKTVGTAKFAVHVENNRGRRFAASTSLALRWLGDSSGVGTLLEPSQGVCLPDAAENILVTESSCQTYSWISLKLRNTHCRTRSLFCISIVNISGH